MKRSTKYKLISAGLLGGVLIAFNQCMTPVSNPKKGSLKFKEGLSNPINQTSSGVTVSRSTSIDAFNKTVYPITKSKCSACHGTSQTPLHASSDINTAYDAIINASKVDFVTPANSRLVLKLRNEKHNCWGNCSDNALEMENQIADWASMINISGTQSSNLANTTKESGFVSSILNPSTAYYEGNISLMTESSSVKSPMIISQENGISFVAVPSTVAEKNLTSNDAGIAYLNFRTSISDFYRIYFYVNAPSSASDTVYVKAAGSDYKEWTIGATTGFQWKELKNTTVNLPTDFYIAADKDNILEIRQKESGVKISKVILTNDPTFDPSQVSKTNLKATLSIPISDLTGVPNSKLEVDIEEFDAYSYKLSMPRIKTTSNILVKKMKVLVNGVFNPQNATYLAIDKMVSSGDSSLSSASMILLKDKGADVDKLSFSFEVIKKN